VGIDHCAAMAQTPEAACDKKWDDVLKRLSPLPVQGHGVPCRRKRARFVYQSKYKTDHPSVFGTYGMLARYALARHDYYETHIQFNMEWLAWSDTWGWDFPMTAMTATRLGLPGRPSMPC